MLLFDGAFLVWILTQEGRTYGPGVLWIHWPVSCTSGMWDVFTEHEHKHSDSINNPITSVFSGPPIWVLMSWETSFHFDVYISLQGSWGFSLSNCSILFFHSYFLSFMILWPILCFFSIIWSLKWRKFQSFTVKLINIHIKQISIVICRACLHALLCLTLTTRSLPGSSIHGIFQARTLERVAISSSLGSLLTQGSNPSLLHLLYWQVDSLPHLEEKSTLKRAS